MRTWAEEKVRRDSARDAKIAAHRALRPRERAIASVDRMKRLGLNPITEGPRELTDDEIAR